MIAVLTSIVLLLSEIMFCVLVWRSCLLPRDGVRLTDALLIWNTPAVAILLLARVMRVPLPPVFVGVTWGALFVLWWYIGRAARAVLSQSHRPGR